MGYVEVFLVSRFACHFGKQGAVSNRVFLLTSVYNMKVAHYSGPIGIVLFVQLVINNLDITTKMAIIDGSGLREAFGSCRSMRVSRPALGMGILLTFCLKRREIVSDHRMSAWRSKLSKEDLSAHGCIIVAALEIARDIQNIPNPSAVY